MQIHVPTDPVRRLGSSALAKMAMLGFLVLVLLIPVVQIRDLVRERMARRAEVAQEITQHWGRLQLLAGPVLTLETWVARPVASQRPAQGAASGTTHGQTATPAARSGGFFHSTDGGERPRVEWARAPLEILPESLVWEGDLLPEIRYRGLFEVVVYEARLRASGHFVVPEIPDAHEIRPEDDLTLAIGISDVRGLQQAVRLQWEETEIDLRPGAAGSSVLENGIHARLQPPAELRSGAVLPFSFELHLRGSDELHFFPGGVTTTVDLSSGWTSPSFAGAYLPRERQIDEAGFQATWEVPYFGRGFPQQWWRGQAQGSSLWEESFGVSLVLPADAYQQTERSVKYAVLFVVLTFGTFFLLELLSPARLHAVQYLLVGFALSLFYVLLLALSEHVGFGLAYLAAAAATVLLISFYARSILGSPRRGLSVLGCLGLLYAYLYVLLQLEDLALLVGAVGLFATLAWIMIATRNLDWFTLRFRDPEAPAEAPTG